MGATHQRPVTPLTYRDSYAQTPQGLAALRDLIGAIFGIDVSPLDRWGHDPSVRSFGWWQGDTLVANVLLYTRHLHLNGQPIRATGVQSVATRPEHRGKGLFSDLLQKALAAADTDLILLITEHPALYTPHGFRPVPEHSFNGPLPAPTGPARHRRLSLDDPEDLALLLRTFERRTPLSRIASASDHPGLFLLKARETPAIALHHLPALDTIVALDPRGPVLLDVVAPAIPPLGAISSALGLGPGGIEVRFTPDRLEWDWDTTTLLRTGLMARGPYLPSGTPSLLSTMRL